MPEEKKQKKKVFFTVSHIACPWLLGHKAGVEETRPLREEADAALACLRIKHGRLGARKSVNQRVGEAEYRPPGSGGWGGDSKADLTESI